MPLRWRSWASIELSPLVARSSWTHRLITAKDHASVQINVGSVDPATGRYTGEFKTYAICGYIRSKVRARLLRPPIAIPRLHQPIPTPMRCINRARATWRLLSSLPRPRTRLHGGTKRTVGQSCLAWCSPNGAGVLRFAPLIPRRFGVITLIGRNEAPLRESHAL